MLYSRNPTTGILEAYTDDGVYLGIISSMGDAVGGMTTDALDWEESEHPRGKAGKFVKKGTGAAGGSADPVSGQEMGELLKAAKTKNYKSAKSAPRPLQSGAERSTIKLSTRSAPKRDPERRGTKEWTERGKKVSAEIQVDGPRETRAFIAKYMAAHPEIKKRAKLYKSVLQNVSTFADRHPEAMTDEGRGTFDAVTGERIDTSNMSGYSVTFHQNKTLDDLYGDYTDDDYAMMCAIAERELGCQGVFIGTYGNPEVSFSCPDFETAMRFAIEHNQHSIYDPERNETIYNPHHSMVTNPIKLTDG